MKKRGFVLLAVLLALSLSLTASAKDRGEKGGDGKMKYPNIEATAKHLEQAKQSLEKVKADLGPHKAEVSKAIDQALTGLRAGMTYADAHPRDKKGGEQVSAARGDRPAAGNQGSEK